MNRISEIIINNFRRYHFVWLAVIILLAAYLRLHNLADNIQALQQDEVVNGYDAYSIGHTLRDHHGNLLPLTLGSFGDSASVALTYLTIPFVVLGGLNEMMVRLPIALTGVASVALIYLLVREVTRNKSMALLGALILALVPWNITLTRWSVPPCIVPFFLLLFLWLFAIAVNRARVKNYALVASALAAAMLTYSYPAAQVIIPFIVLSGGLIYLHKRKRDLIIFIVSYAVITLPLFYLILFDTSSNFARLNALRLTSTGWQLVGDVASRYQEYFSFNFYFGPTANNPLMHVPGIGNFYSFLAIFVVLVAVIVIFNLVRQSSRKDWIKKLKRPEIVKLAMFSTVCFLLAPIPASLSVDKGHVTRAIFTMPLMTLVITACVYFVLSRIRLASLRIVAVVFFVSATLLATSNYFQNYTMKYPATTASYFLYGVREGMQYLINNQGDYKHIIVDRNIGQPYIYYLFYSGYNPENINYGDMNVGLGKQPFVVDKINNYSFVPLNKESVKGATYIESIEGYGKKWYDIYSRGDDELIMTKRY